MTSEEYETAYTTGYKHVVGFLINRNVPRQDAEDYAQGAWLNAWAHREDIRDPNAALRYVDIAALNLYRNAYKTGKRYVFDADAAFQHLHGRAIDTDAIDCRRILDLARDADAGLLSEHYVFGRTTQEIADRSERSWNAVKIALSRANHRLRCEVNKIAVVC